MMAFYLYLHETPSIIFCEIVIQNFISFSRVVYISTLRFIHFVEHYFDNIGNLKYKFIHLRKTTYFGMRKYSFSASVRLFDSSSAQYSLSSAAETVFRSHTFKSNMISKIPLYLVSQYFFYSFFCASITCLSKEQPH